MVSADQSRATINEFTSRYITTRGHRQDHRPASMDHPSVKQRIHRETGRV